MGLNRELHQTMTGKQVKKMTQPQSTNETTAIIHLSRAYNQVCCFFRAFYFTSIACCTSLFSQAKSGGAASLSLCSDESAVGERPSESFSLAETEPLGVGLETEEAELDRAATGL